MKEKNYFDQIKLAKEAGQLNPDQSLLLELLAKIEQDLENICEAIFQLSSH